MSGDSKRGRAVRELGAALRAFNEAAVSTEVDVSTIDAITEEVRAQTAKLMTETRSVGEVATVDTEYRPRRLFNPAAGSGNPLAPPMLVESTTDGRAIGRCTLGLVYEGPTSYCHGGISALLLDQILGHAHAARGQPGVTARLSLRYRRPVPLLTPLLLVGEVERADERYSTVKATITTEDDPDAVLVAAEGRFANPTSERAQRLFGRPSATATRHDGPTNR